MKNFDNENLRLFGVRLKKPYMTSLILRDHFSFNKWLANTTLTLSVKKREKQLSLKDLFTKF